MTRFISGLGALALGLAATAASAVPIAGLYNTGVDNAGAALAADVGDSHYAFSVVAGTAVGTGGYGVVQKDQSAELFNWTLNPAPEWNDAVAHRYSRWLAPAVYPFGVYPPYDPTSAGIYRWTTTFNLSVSDLPTAVLSGRVGADNFVKVFLNGSPIASSAVDNNNSFGFNVWSFTEKDAVVISLTNGAYMVAGTNQLTFEVTNIPGDKNPTGLRAYFDQSVTAVPEPGTWALMASGLLLLSLGANRRRATLRA